MPTIPSPILGPELLRTIEDAEEMHQLILVTQPDSFIADSDEIELVSRLYSLVEEHHAAILYLLRAGQFDGSAFALARPLVDGAYRAHWLYCCAKPATIKRIREGGNCYPPFEDMAKSIEERMPTDGLFTAVVPYIKSLHGFTHGGLEQLARRIDEDGNVKPSYAVSDKQKLIKFTTAHLTVLSIAWCQLISKQFDRTAPRSKQIIAKYIEIFGPIGC
jgi:hypothetical protein